MLKAPSELRPRFLPWSQAAGSKPPSLDPQYTLTAVGDIPVLTRNPFSSARIGVMLEAPVSTMVGSFKPVTWRYESRTPAPDMFWLAAHIQSSERSTCDTRNSSR